MNSDLGAEISELLAHLSSITVPAHPNPDWVTIRELQRRLDGKAASLRAEHRIRAELAEEQRWAETDIHGFERALVLVGDGDTGASRLEHRINARLVRLAELGADSEEIDERIRRIEEDIVSTQQALAVVLRRTIGDAEQKLQAARQARLRRKAAFKAMFGGLDETPLWSPYAVMGYRVWLLEKNRLHGAWHRWDVPHLVAVCEKGSDVPHTDGRCAEIGFGCGIYAAKDVTVLMGEVGVSAHKGRIAVGLVGLEGKVVEHERGYRGQRATVLALAVADLNRIYLVDDPQELATVFGSRIDSQPPTTDRSLTLADTASLRTAIATYLENQARRRALWTSANPNG